MTPATAATIAAASEAMYSAGNNTPALDPRLAADWTLIEHITAKDALFGLQHIGLGQRVYYGFLAQSKSDPTQFVASVRGTETVLEWLEDGLAVLTNHVEAGFYSIYSTMECGMPAQSAADGISTRVPLGATVTVVGHSLGAPLAAYLLMALIKMNVKATGMFFAMPRPGDGLFATMFDIAVGSDKYMVWNYVRDVVPNLPLWLPLHPFARLNNRIVIRPSDSTAVIPDGVAEAHHADNYAKLLANLKPQVTP
jgi:triacylglycerol lipase